MQAKQRISQGCVKVKNKPKTSLKIDYSRRGAKAQSLVA
jgi:hypothetical protein